MVSTVSLSFANATGGVDNASTTTTNRAASQAHHRQVGIMVPAVSLQLLYVDTKGSVHYRGRIDRCIKVNGKLVYPEEVEKNLAELGGVSSVFCATLVLYKNYIV